MTRVLLWECFGILLTGGNKLKKIKYKWARANHEKQNKIYQVVNSINAAFVADREDLTICGKNIPFCGDKRLQMQESVSVLMQCPNGNVRFGLHRCCFKLWVLPMLFLLFLFGYVLQFNNSSV